VLEDLRPRYDAVIVGARAAGAATAMLLARRGLTVLAVDRAPYGTDTISTHALMRAGVLQLSRWGLLERLEREGTPRVSRTVFHYDDETLDIPIKPREGVPALFAPRRTVLDRLLVDAAVEAGAEVRHRVRAVHVLQRGERAEGVALRDADGGARAIRAGIVIGADGTRSALAALLGARVTRHGRHASATIYGYWTGLEPSGYQWYWSPGASAGLIPTNAGETLVFASIAAERFGSELRGDLSGAYHRILAQAAPGLQLGGARLEGPLYAFAGLRGHFRKAWGPGWALVGDASHFKDPITAHGISDALRDAELLADAIENGRLADYEAARDALSTRLFEVSDRVASFQWDTRELKELHAALSEEMKREVAAMLERDFALAS